MITKSYIHSSTVFNLTAFGTAGSIAQDKILIDASYSFQVNNIVARADNNNVLTTIQIDSDEYLCKGTYLENAAMIDSAQSRAIAPFLIKKNSQLIITVENQHTSANKVQLSFIGLKIID